MQKSSRTLQYDPFVIRGPAKKISEAFIERYLTNVKAQPNKIAIQTSNTSLTYQQLHAEVMHWKNYFANTSHTCVMVCLQRTPRLLAILLALQWLNMPYIPLDPTLPFKRLKAIQIDSGAEAFIFDHESNNLYADLNCVKYNLNHPLECLATPSTPHPKKNNPLAYIIYTSGSTGVPKGVMISRRALNNFLMSMSHYFLKASHEMILAVTTIAFDIAALELFLPIWQGQTVFIANQEEHKDPFSIAALVQAHPITLLQATPGMWRLLEGIQWLGKPNLIALTGGEPLTQNLAQGLLPKVKALWNMYGPTEATIWCSLKQIHPHEPITVGRPIHNMEMYVLDKEGNVLPPYVKGELYVSGLGLAEGYVNHPKLTHEQFKSDLRPGKILYHVGDLACSTTEGEIIIFGRTDNQVKLHGYRIELEDIEAHVQAQPNVRECAVAIFHEQLIAYICPVQKQTFSADALLKKLATEIPEYMVPQRVIELEHLPLTPNGKINRKSLPTPATTPHYNEGAEFHTPEQEILIQLWQDELNLPGLSIKDNFFELGGHSLLAGRILARIYQHFDRKITLNRFYDAPTIEKLTEVIAKTPPSSDQKKGNKCLIFKRDQWFPLNDFQSLLWMSHFFEPNVKKLNILGRRRLKGKVNLDALNRALSLVYQKHEVFSYSINRWHLVQKHSKKPLPKWIVENLESENIEDTEAVLLKSYRALNDHYPWPSHLPLLITKLFYLPNHCCEIQISMPHIISDENSIPIFFNDLTNAYLFYLNNMPLDVRDTQQLYKTYAIYDYQKLIEHEREDNKFWLDYFRDTRITSFPKRHIIAHMGSSSYSTYTPLPEALLNTLQRFCINHNITMSDALCAATGLTVNLFDEGAKSRANLYLSIVKSTRDDKHYDPVIGCFLRLFPIKINLNHNQNLAQVAKQVQQETLKTAEHQFASSIIKLSSIGHFPMRKYPLLQFIMTQFLDIFGHFSHRFYIPPTLLHACAKLAFFERRKNFLININIWSNLLNKPKTENTCLGLPFSNYPSPQFDISQVDFVFDVGFLRDDYNQQPYLVISSNVTADFRQQFATKFIELLSKDF